MWDRWKKGFGLWEGAAAKWFDAMLRSPAVLEPSGAWFTATMKAKAASDKMVAGWWGAVGLPTKRDQERTLHALGQLESKLLDLEERLEDTK